MHILTKKVYTDGLRRLAMKRFPDKEYKKERSDWNHADPESLYILLTQGFIGYFNYL